MLKWFHTKPAYRIGAAVTAALMTALIFLARGEEGNGEAWYLPAAVAAAVAAALYVLSMFPPPVLVLFLFLFTYL